MRNTYLHCALTVVLASIGTCLASAADRPLWLERTMRLPDGSDIYDSAGSDRDGDGVHEILRKGLSNDVEILSGVTGKRLSRLEGEPDPNQTFANAMETIPDGDGDQRRDLLLSATGLQLGRVQAVKSSAGGGPIGEEDLLYEIAGSVDARGIGASLDTTGTLGMTTCAEPPGVILFDLRDGQVLLRLLATQDPNFPNSAAWLGDVNGDGFEDFAAGGQNGYVIDGTLRSSEWIEATRETIGTKLLAELRSPEGLQPGVHGGSPDRELFADLGDPHPGDGMRERLIVCGEPHHDNGGAIAAFLLVAMEDGSFDAREVAFLEPWGSIGHDLAALGDVDGDGVGDVAVFQPGFEPGGRVLVLSGAGLVDGFEADDVIQDLRPDAAFQFYQTMRKLGDQDGDGHEELLVAGLSREDTTRVVTIYDILAAPAQPTDCNENGIADSEDVAQARPDLSAPISVATGNFPVSLAAADFDDDGVVDVAVGTTSPSLVTILHNDASGKLDPSGTYGLEKDPFAMVAADFNGDGHADIAAVEFARLAAGGTIEIGNSVAVLLNRGDGTFRDPARFTVGEMPGHIAAGDIDGDGDADLVAGASAGGSPRISILANDGAGAFNFLEEHESAGKPLALVDFDGDRDPDIVHGSFSILTNSGDGHFSRGPDFNSGLLNADALAVADFDRDGDWDVAATHENHYGISLLHNDGMTSTTQARFIGYDSPFAIAARDIDRDGYPDLITANREGSSGVWVLPNGGAGGFLSTFRFPAGQRPTALAVADLDANGWLDIVVAGSESDDISVLLNHGTGQTSFDCNYNGVPDECDVASGTSKDSNANGRPDECEKIPFHRGDANGDGLTDISDAIGSLRFLFLDGGAPPCLDAADSNGDDRHDVSDAIFTLGFLFLGGRPPPLPGPAPGGCGLDPGEGIGLGCIRYDSC